MKLSVVVLTMNNRPVELARAVRSALAQRDVDVEVVLVGNGVQPEISVEDPRIVKLALPENLGIPGGRNEGTAVSSGEIVLYLDDDGFYPDTGLGAYLAGRFAADPKLGIISFQVKDPEGGGVSRRHVPRIRVGDPDRSSAVTTFLGGASAMRRTVFDETGGLPAEFFYAHEETDLAWQALDRGYRIEYDATAIMCHPKVSPARHDDFYRMNARNRVWLARRNLPWPLAVTYLSVWATLMVARERSPKALRPWFRGFAEGWRTPAGARRPIHWATAWRMTRTGRPPII